MTDATMEMALKYAQRIAAGSRMEKLQRVWITPNDENHAVIYATDSFVAGRIETALEYDGPSVSVPLPPKNLALTFLDFATLGDTEHTMPSLDRLFDTALEQSEMFEYRHSVGRPDTRVSEWSYFDNERRRPGGVFKLTAAELGPANPGKADIMFERGLKVDSHDKLSQGGAGFYWSDKVQPLGTIEGNVAKLPSGKDDYLGVYYASYLWPIEHAAWIGWTDALKPLYMVTPHYKAEFISMGIRI